MSRDLEKSLERRSLDFNSVSMAWKRELESRKRVADLGKRFDMMYKSMLTFNTPTLVAVIGILLKMILAP